MNKQDLLQAVLASDELPTLPTVASKLISLTSREETTLTDIAELVSQDISLCSKILKVSNSAFYSFPQQIGSIKQAISVLGTNAVRSLVLSFSFLSMKSGAKPSTFNFEKFWERSLASAVAAKIILEKVKGADTEEVFISGLLQNLGELIFARTFPEKYEQVLAAMSDEHDDPRGTEQSIIGADHCFIGFEVARSWGFPNVLLQPIIYHHDPSQYAGEDRNIRATVKAVYLSDVLINILFSKKPEAFHRQFRKQAKKLLGLSSQHIENILQEVHIKVVQAGEFFGLKIKDTVSVQEILQEANIKLSLLNLDYDQMNKQLVQAKIALENLTRELEEKNVLLDNLAKVDGLTGVYNHRYFQQALATEIDRSIRQDSSIGLIITDIDHFKSFNDNYGHQTGDFILKAFCKVLQSALRKYDTLARYGGEEFAIILPATEAEEAMSVAEKLRKKIEGAVFDDGRETYGLTSSFGVAVSRPGREEHFSNALFIGRADEALYEAKKQGRNRSSIWQQKKKWFKFRGNT